LAAWAGKADAAGHAVIVERRKLLAFPGDRAPFATITLRNFYHLS